MAVETSTIAKPNVEPALRSIRVGAGSDHEGRDEPGPGAVRVG